VIELVAHIVAIRAVWRMTVMINREAGPLDLLAKARHLIGIRYTSMSQCYAENVIGRMVCCRKCLSIWVALALVLIALPGISWREVIVYTLAWSGGAILVDRWEAGGNKVPPPTPN
jgi:Protein of unknown function (DUF1360)